jgi:hypothetical protein
MEDLERVVEDDYKFLNRNVRSCSAWWETWRASGARAAERSTME